MRLPRFIRRFFRRRMHPRSEEEAWSIKDKLSIAYAVIAWNAFGFVLYQLYKGNAHWPVKYGIKTEDEELVRPAIQYASMFGYPKASVYRISGAYISDERSIELEKGGIKGEELNVRLFNSTGDLLTSGTFLTSSTPSTSSAGEGEGNTDSNLASGDFQQENVDANNV